MIDFFHVSKFLFQEAWSAAIMLHYNQSYILLCSGTILSEYYILTAAHCKKQAQFLLRSNSEDVLKANLTIIMGVSDPTQSDNIIKVKKGIKRHIETFEIHPNYQGRAYYDTALINLDSKIIFSKVRIVNRDR